MKRIVTLALVAVMTVSALSLNAQNKFKGIVKYTLSSVGSVPVDIPAAQSTLEVKVLGDKVNLKDANMQMGRTSVTYIDLGGLIGFLGSQDITLESYDGDGKIAIKNTITQGEIDSLTIPCTEGMYIEYKDDAKKVAGVDCKKAVMHVFSEEGQENLIEIWYAPEIGPDVAIVPFAVYTKGMPLEFTQDGGDGRVIKFTATEVIKGKVKDVDFLPQSGYKELSPEAWTALQNEIMEIQEMLSE